MTIREKPSSCSHCASFASTVHEQQEEIERLERVKRDVLAAGQKQADRAALAEASVATLHARIGELEQEMRDFSRGLLNRRTIDTGQTVPQIVTRWTDQLAALLASSGVQKQEEAP